jgi:hypothetical protein
MAPRVPNRYLNPPKRRGVGTVALRNGAPTGAPRQNQPARQGKLTQAAIDRAVQNVSQALMRSDPTMRGNAAVNLAKIILTRPGVKIGAGKKGFIFYQGKRFSPNAFANSKLAKLASGATAAAANQQAITSSPDYQQALATLGLNRDQSLAGLQDQQRQALIEYGDPTFAGSDAQTAAFAGANPFSTQNLMRQQYQQNLNAAAQAANRLGVAGGGGAISGQQAAQRAYAGQVQDAVTKLQQLLGQISGQEAAARQAYNIGQQQAATDAYNTLLASGYHAAQAPNWQVGQFHLRQPAGVKGFGKKQPGAGLPPIAPGFPGGKPVVGPPPPYNGGNPPQAGPGGGVPNRYLPQPPAQGLGGVDMSSIYRRYGIGY